MANVASSVLAALKEVPCKCLIASFTVWAGQCTFLFHSVSKGCAMKCVHCSGSSCYWVILLASGRWNLPLQPAEEHSPVSRLRGARHQWPLKVAHRSSELNAFWNSSAKSKECGSEQRYGLGLVSCSEIGCPCVKLCSAHSQILTELQWWIMVVWYCGSVRCLIPRAHYLLPLQNPKHRTVAASFSLGQKGGSWSGHLTGTCL